MSFFVKHHTSLYYILCRASAICYYRNKLININLGFELTHYGQTFWPIRFKNVTEQWYKEWYNSILKATIENRHCRQIPSYLGCLDIYNSIRELCWS